MIDVMDKGNNTIVNNWNFGKSIPRDDEKNKSNAINMTESVVKKPIDTE